MPDTWKRVSATRRAPVGVTSPSDIHLTVTITFGQALAWGSESLAGFTSFDLYVLGGNARMPVPRAPWDLLQRSTLGLWDLTLHPEL